MLFIKTIKNLAKNKFGRNFFSPAQERRYMNTMNF